MPPMLLGLRGVLDATGGRRHGLEAGRGDRSLAPVAQTVGSVLHAGQGGVDGLQRLLEGGGQRLGLTLLGRDLARVGEVGVVGQRVGGAVADAELPQLREEVGPLGFELGLEVAELDVRHG